MHEVTSKVAEMVGSHWEVGHVRVQHVALIVVVGGAALLKFLVVVALVFERQWHDCSSTCAARGRRRLHHVWRLRWGHVVLVREFVAAAVYFWFLRFGAVLWRCLRVRIGVGRCGSGSVWGDEAIYWCLVRERRVYLDTNQNMDN